MTSEAEIDSVDELFETESEETTEVAEVAEEETEEVKGEMEKSETEPPSEEESTLVPRAAMHDFRRKWQEEKDRADKLESLIPKEETKAPDMYEDPEGYKAWVREEVVREQDEESSKKHQQKVDESRSAMLEKQEDYEEKEKAFMMLTMYDADLAARMNSSEDPALFAYEKGKEYLESLVPKDVSHETLEEEATEEKIVKGPRLVTATAVASNSKPVEKEEDLNDMFEDQKY